MKINNVSRKLRHRKINTQEQFGGEVWQVNSEENSGRYIKQRSPEYQFINNVGRSVRKIKSKDIFRKKNRQTNLEEESGRSMRKRKSEDHSGTEHLKINSEDRSGRGIRKMHVEYEKSDTSL